MPAPANILARARSDAQDRLVHADEPLLGMQLRNGGELPGIIAAPALLDLVRRARHFGLRLAAPVTAQDGGEKITAWVEVTPTPDADGCDIAIASWRTEPVPAMLRDAEEARQRDIVRHVAELSLRLNSRQDVLAVDCRADDLRTLAARIADGTGRPWTDFAELPGNTHQQPLHWRLLDGTRVRLDGSDREWVVHLFPQGRPDQGIAGFELHFTSDTPPPDPVPDADMPGARAGAANGMGRDIAPVLRQPIARIIANAETIRTRLAGPLADEYEACAADIASAGEHLLALIDDLADLEVVEDEQFSTAPDRIDLADLARRAAGILGVRARERGIALDAPRDGESVPAIGEFRRVLQVLLNLVGNAIRYTPEGSQVWLRVEREGDRARIVVADQGEGLSEEQQARVFEKFERLGRSGDGGSGLGLYISRRLARAMDGDLTVDSAPGQGARFILDLPANLDD